MKKRIISLVTAFALTVIYGLGSVGYGADDTASYDASGYQECRELLSAIGADVSMCDDSQNEVTRAEFVYILMQLAGCDTSAERELPFGDVGEFDYYRSALSYALDLDIVSEADMFHPYRVISVNEASKMAVAALGRTWQADVRGGYPYGFVSVASDCGLTDGVASSGDSALTRREFYTFVQNFLVAEVFDVSGFKDGDVILTDGRDVLSVYHDIYIAEGIVTANEFSALYDSSAAAGEGFAEIDNISYRCIDDALLGRRVRAYVRSGSSDDTIIYFDYSDNDSLIADCLDLDVVASGTFEYETEGKIRKIALDTTPAFIYNGKADPKILLSDFAGFDGTVEFTDSDSDGKYDVADITCGTVVCVESVNAVDKYIIGKNSAFVDLGSDADMKFFVTVNGKAAQLSNIPTGSIALCSTSRDGLLTDISVCTDSVSGTVDGYDHSRKLIMIGGVAYRYGKNFETYCLNEAVMGAKGTLTFSGRGIAEYFVREGKSKMKFGYFIDVKKESGLSSALMLKLCTSEDKIEVVEVSDKVTLNGKSGCGEADVVALLTDNEGAVAQILRYSQDSKGRVNCIDTKGKTGFMTGNEPEDDNLTLYKFPDGSANTQIYLSSTSIVFPFFAVGDDAVTFAVSNDERLSDEKRYRAYSSKYYLNSIDQDVRLDKTEVYNVSPENVAGAMVIMANVHGSPISDYSPSGVVYTVTKAIIEDGDVCLKVVVAGTDKFKTYYIKDEDVLKAVNPDASFGNPCITSGDVIRVSAGADGTIGAFLLDFDYSEEKVYKTSDSHNALCTYYYAKVYTNSSGTVTAIPLNIKGVDTTITDNPMRFIWRISGNVPIYDAESNNVYYGSCEEMRTYPAFSDKCSKILVRTLNGAVRGVVVYK